MLAVIRVGAGVAGAMLASALACPAQAAAPPLGEEAGRGFEQYREFDEGRHQFKVFAASPEGAWGYSTRLTFERAKSDALETCAHFGEGCRIYAVGNTVVWDEDAEARALTESRYAANKRVLDLPYASAPIGGSGLNGFQEYQAHDEGLTQFKAFILADDGAWGWRVRLSLETALEAARETCARFVRRGTCRPFAIGDTVVWDMDEASRAEAVDRYRAGKQPLDVPYRDAPLGGSSVEGFEEYRAYVDRETEFKAFMLGDDGAWGWRVRLSLDAALEAARETCARHADWGECRLFALGDTVVWKMDEPALSRAVAAYRDRKRPLDEPVALAPLGGRSLEGFRTYERFDEGPRAFKVFVLSEEGSWAYRTRPTLERALDAAFESCGESAKTCRLFAVGNTVVWAMSERERLAVLAQYGASKARDDRDPAQRPAPMPSAPR